MREIKFRAWDETSKRMITEPYPNGIYPMDGQTTPMIYFSGGIALMSDEDGGKSGLWEHDNAGLTKYFLMQYIGLKDKNGKDIYEGDIVKLRYVNAIVNGKKKYGIDHLIKVTYSPPLFCGEGFALYSIGKGETSFYPFAFTDTAEREVIGNIYENPELLKDNDVKTHQAPK